MDHKQRVEQAVAAIREATPRVTGCQAVELPDGTWALAYYGDGSRPGERMVDPWADEVPAGVGEESQADGDIWGA